MSMTTLQGAFTSGEISPSLIARVDFAKYAQGCKRLSNMLVQPHGGAVKRPGFLLLDTLPSKAVLVPFVFNAEQSYVLCFGDRWLRIATPDGVIVKDGAPYQIASPYTLEQAKTLSSAQSADILFIACAGVRPHKLKRLAHDRWEFEAMTFVCPLSPPQWDSKTVTNTWDEYTRAYENRSLYYGQSSGDDNYSYVLIREDLYRKTAKSNTVYIPNLEFVNGAVDSAGKNSKAQLVTPYTYYITAVDAEGNESEASPGAQITGPSSNNWQAGDYVILRWLPVAGAVEYRIYKGEFGGRPGYISTTGSLTFQDYNHAPTIADGPPKWVDPFKVGDGVYDFPSVVGFFEQRLVFLSSTNRPQTLWFSRSGDYDNFSASSPLKADDSLELTLASNEVSRMVWMIALRSLVLGSVGMEWEITSSEGAFTAKTAKATPQSYRGSAPMRALIIDNTILHITRAGNEVRAFKYDYASDSYAGSDKTILSEHLFEGKYLVSWAYQPSPDSIVWCVRDDGVLLGLTFQQEHDVYAWHQHHTQGKFLSVCSIPNRYNDELFAVTERDGQVFLEILAPRYLGGDTADCVFLDCALTATSKEGSSVFSGMGHLEGKTVSILADGAVCPKQVVKDGKIQLKRPVHAVTVGLSYTAELETMPVEVVSQQGTSVGRKKKVNATNIFFKDTVIAKVGHKTGELKEPNWRTSENYGDGISATTGTRRIVLPTHSENSVSILVQSEEPLPVTVVAIVNEVEVN